MLEKWPLGLRLYRPSDSPRSMQLRPGYQFEQIENSTDCYRFSAVTDTPGVLSLFEQSTLLFSDTAFFILEFYPEERREEALHEGAAPTVFYSPYMPIDEMLEELAPYMHRLIHDGFVGFGIANNRSGLELFFSEEKVLTCFTGNHIRTMDLFSRQGLSYRKNLVYPTDFAHDHLSLMCFRPQELPPELSQHSPEDLDYGRFCQELVDHFDMYPVEGNVSFFLSEKEQDQIAKRLESHPRLSEYAEEDFGAFLYDWIDFARECQEGFGGDLLEYRQCLSIRDLIQYVAEGVADSLADKLLSIVAEADEQLRSRFAPKSRRLDAPEDPDLASERFWYHGVVRDAGPTLRRDLIRSGLYG